MAVTAQKQKEPASAGSNVLTVNLEGFSVRWTPILGKIDFEIRRGETLALMGPSGIGKTTLLRIVAGLESSYRGTVRLRGISAVVFQEPTLLRWRTLEQNLCLAARVTGTEAMTYLDRVGLADKADLFPDQLSLGQQRRLSLARAFALNPDILLMDEPFVSLDPDLAEDMMTLFENLRAQNTPATLLITHDQREADRLADRIIRLEGNPAELV